MERSRWMALLVLTAAAAGLGLARPHQGGGAGAGGAGGAGGGLGGQGVGAIGEAREALGTRGIRGERPGDLRAELSADARWMSSMERARQERLPRIEEFMTNSLQLFDSEGNPFLLVPFPQDAPIPAPSAPRLPQVPGSEQHGVEGVAAPAGLPALAAILGAPRPDPEAISGRAASVLGQVSAHLLQCIEVALDVVGATAEEKAKVLADLNLQQNSKGVEAALSTRQQLLLSLLQKARSAR